MFVKPIKGLVKKKKKKKKQKTKENQTNMKVGLGDDPNITSICPDTSPDQLLLFSPGDGGRVLVLCWCHP